MSYDLNELKLLSEWTNSVVQSYQENHAKSPNEYNVELLKEAKGKHEIVVKAYENACNDMLLDLEKPRRFIDIFNSPVLYILSFLLGVSIYQLVLFLIKLP